MKHVIVTAADEAYAALLLDLLDSLRPHAGKLEFAIACLDLGLSPSTRSQVADLADHVVDPQWPFRPHTQFDKDRRFLSRAARPFLRDLVPGYSTYIWLDADVWVQHALGLKWLLEAADGTDIAAAPTVHRCYAFKAQDVGWMRMRYRMAFGEPTANQLMQNPYVNSGVMAIPGNSKFWPKVANRFQDALDRWEGTFLSDQAIINGALLLDDLKFERLPARVNWICHLSRPLWDPARKQLVEPAMPFDPILILHNTFNDKALDHDIFAMDGRPRKTKLTYSAISSLS